MTTTPQSTKKAHQGALNYISMINLLGSRKIEMKKQIIFSLVLIFLLFGIGSAAIVSNLLNSAASLNNLISLHEIENIRKNVSIRLQSIQGYINLPAKLFSSKTKEIADKTQQLQVATQDCFGCHHPASIVRDIAHTETLINSFKQSVSNFNSNETSQAKIQENKQQTINSANEILLHVQNLTDRATEILHNKSNQATTDIQRSYTILIFTFLTTFGLAVIIAHFLIKKITTPIDELLDATRKIKNGELGCMTKAHGPKEFTELLNTFNSMSLALAERENENKALYEDLEKRIHELHKTQHQLVIADKLASLGRLAGGISHDFNNILCGIIGHISLLKVNFDKEASQYSTLETLEKASFHASKLVKQLQTFANLKDWQEIPVNLNHIIISVTQSIKHTLEKDIQVVMQLSDNLFLTKGDPDRFQELLQNICNNSIQAITNKGCLTITTSNRHLTEIKNEDSPLPAGQYIRITIEDDGVGIPEDVLPQVYDPYFSTKELGSQKGMGLGMAIAFSIVSKHEGHIHLESTEGAGTTVKIDLPAMQSS